MARKTKEEAEKTRKDILQAALNMFCTKGYTRTTLDDIAKSINLTKGAVYWYFRNKPDILKALMLEDFKETEKKLNDKMPEPQNLDDLKLRFMCVAEMVDNDANFRKLLYFLLFQMEWSEGLVNSFKDIFEEFKERLEGSIKMALEVSQEKNLVGANVDVEAMTNTIHALWHGLLVNKLNHQNEVSLVKTASYGFDFVINTLYGRKD